MIVGLFLKNYKVYDGLKFIPISNGTNFSSIFGPNGSGKSSILEALDTFFNDREWNIYKGNTGYVNTPFIVPIFLLEENELNKSGKINAEYYNLIKKISDYVWNLKTFPGSSPEMSIFIKFKDELRGKYSDSYILPLGIMYNSKSPFFGSFQRDAEFLKIFGIPKQQIDNQTERARAEDEAVANYFNNKESFIDYIKNIYYYAYIPTETNVAEYTKLETNNMQMFMHKDIKQAIADAITEEKLDSINLELKEFVESISKKLKYYTYKKPIAGKNNITMQDLINTIITAFFSIRVLTLKDDSISVDKMSSGEKRKALIDVAFAFLDSENQQTKKIILAIDEPELSLHISACFEQFEKLKHISRNNHQVLITTHWYGFLPIIYDGLGINVLRNQHARESIIEYYDLSKYREEIKIASKTKKIPLDIKLKGKYDLVQSIISSLLCDTPYNYIFVEGSSDKIYLDFYLEDYISNNHLRIVPLGGATEVCNIIESLEFEIEHSSCQIKGKVLGIIDTDANLVRKKDINDNNYIFLRRLQYDKNIKDIRLLKINSNPICPPTDIEDTLDPHGFIDVLKFFIENDNDNSYILPTKDFNSESKCSYNIYDYTETERDLLKDFFKINKNYRKVEFANKYTKLANKETGKSLALIREIIGLFDFNY